MRVAFVTNQLGVRGTEVALATYAEHARAMWGWTAAFVVRHARGERPDSPDCTAESYAHYEARFPVTYEPDDAALDAWLGENADVAFLEVSGLPDADFFPTSVPVVAHCVFTAARELPVAVQAAISESVARKGVPGVAVLPYVAEPYAPDAPRDLRGELGIPADAVVFGRHGGYDTFDLPWVHEVVAKTAARRPHVHFAFLNTRPWPGSDLPNVHFVPATTDPAARAAFVATCDAMLHAREDGETFGLAVAEFALRRLPVFTHSRARDTEHLRLLGDQAVVYHGPWDLESQIKLFRPRRTGPTGYEAYTARAVMPLFGDLAQRALLVGPRGPDLEAEPDAEPDAEHGHVDA